MIRSVFVPLLVAAVAIGAAQDQSLVGKVAPPLSLESVIGAPGGNATWKDLAGKITVIEFWFTTCGPCRQSIPHMNGLTRKFKDQPIQFVSITFDPAAEVKRFTSEVPIEGWIGIDTDQSTIKAFGVKSYPTTVVVGKDGKVLAVTRPDTINEGVLNDAIAGRQLNLKPSTMDSNGQPPAAAPAETTDEDLVFRVDLKKSKRMGNASFGALPNGISMEGVAIQRIADFAYSHDAALTDMVLPPDENIYDIKVQVGDMKRLSPVLASWLEAYLGLESHFEERPTKVAVITLVGDPKGLVPTKSEGGSVSAGKAVGVGISTLLSFIAYPLKAYPIDETGLTGRYDYQIEFDSSQDIVKKALEKYNLKVTIETRPMKYLVVRPKKK